MRKIAVEFKCAINGANFSIGGHIELADGAGFCSAALSFDRKKLPSGFIPELLSYVAITGYPGASLSVGSAHNPFTKPTNNFKSVRSLDLGSAGELKTTYSSENRGTDKEKLTFQVFGKVDIQDEIVSISPVSEMWTPKDNSNAFSGEMTFTWKLKTGKTISGHAMGEYNVQGEKLSVSQMRIITFDLETGADHFLQHETIRLYDLKEWKDSVRKIA
jgi:hypothetical protein